MQSWVFDLEADNLYLQSSKIWYIRFKTCDNTRSLQVFPFREGYDESRSKILDWIESFEDGAIVQGWNNIGYDLWMLWKHFDIPFSVGKAGKDFLGGKHVQFQDGYILSMYLNPNSPKHSLEYVSGGEAAEEGKINYRESLVKAGAMSGDEPKGHEFSFYHDLLIPYCDRDVDACAVAIEKLNRQAVGLYKDKWLHPSFKQMQKDYWLYSAQAYSGVKFDVEKAKILSECIEQEMKKIKDYVDPQLPSRPLKSTEMLYYKQPAKPFTKSGEYSATLIKFLEKHKAKIQDGKIVAYGFEVEIESNAILPVKLPMEIEDNAELKQYFLDSGWIPSDDYWNIQKDPDTGKPVRDERGKVIKTTPKINVAGQLCPNLEKLEGDVPKNVVKFLSYRNRLGVVTGWLNNWRIAFDGRLSAEISGYAPTSRVKHKTVVNCPKADPKVLLGSEMRELFRVEDGNHYVGTDAAALENRTLSHYTYRYDNGAFARMQMDGDAHSYSAFAFFPELHKRFDINTDNKENPDFKSYRNKAKTGAYLLAFGGGAPKLASSLGLTTSAGKAAFNNYWEMNKGLGLLKAAVEKYFETTGLGKHIVAIDGRVVHVRGKNVLLSCLGQGLGAICMSYAACLMDTWLGEMFIDHLGRPYYLVDGKQVKRISMVHDEYSWECDDGAEEHVRALSVKAIVRAGELLKLALPLAAEGKIGKNWKDVH